MLKKCVLFLFLLSVVGFPVFSATQPPADSGSSQKGKPSVKFKTWQVGRSAVGTDPTDPVHTSFITSTQEECHFTASVGYDGTQGDNVSPIDPSTVSWTLTAQDPSSLAIKTSDQNWSGSHPSKFNVATSFNVVGTISVPKVVGTRPVKKKDGSIKIVPDYLSATACSHIDDADRLKRVPRHRDNTKLGFTLVFSAKTEDGQAIQSAKLVLKADDIDQLRQEYVDYGRPIPGRTDSRLQSQDYYDFGHYQIMLNIGLGSKMLKWVEEINKLRGTDPETGEKIPAFAVGDFLLTSGYRNPHHNFDHSNSTALLSPHMYGSALDVRGTTDAHGKTLDINGDKNNDAADRNLMARAAKPNAGARYTSVYDNTKHVHADWAPSDWASRKSTSDAAPSFSLPPQGRDTALVENPDTAPNAPRVACLGGCGDQIPVSEQATYHLKEDCIGCGQDYYTCDDSEEHVIVHNLYAPESMRCGHLYWTCNKGDCGQKFAFCPKDPTRCSARDEWLCQHESCIYAANVNPGIQSTPTNANTNPNTNPPPPPPTTTPTPTTTTNPPQPPPPDPPTTNTGNSGNTGNTNGNTNNGNSGNTGNTGTTNPPTNNGNSGNGNTGTTNPPTNTGSPTTNPPTNNGNSGNTGNTNNGNSGNTGGTSTETVPGSPSVPITYHACGVHESSVSGDHRLQASCSRDTRCIATNFYYCQHTSHTYPAPPEPVTYHACGVHESSVSGDHRLQASCSRDTSCIATNFYYCQHTSHEYAPVPPPVTVKCGNAWKGDGKCKYGRVISGTDPEEHRTTCLGGHKYWTCNVGALDRHQTRTCTRCDQSYSKCTNSETACDFGRRWHTEDADPWMYGSCCTHTFRKSDYDYHEKFYTCARSGCDQQFIKCSRPTCLANSSKKCTTGT